MSASQSGERSSRTRPDGEWPTGTARVRDWFLIDGNRLTIAALLTLGIFVLLLVLGELGLIAFVNDDSITRMAGGMIAGTFSLITLVVSINQLILSREFTAADESRERLSGVLQFRDDVADVAALPTSPASPSRLLEAIALAIHARTDRLEEATTSGDRVDAAVEEFIEDLRADTNRLDDILADSEFGTFEAVSATIGYDDAWHLYQARYLHARHGDHFPVEATEALEEIIGGLELFAVAREHLKTTFLQREVTRFSQLTIFVGVPAAFAAIVLGFLFADIAGATIADGYLPPVTSALTAIVFSPLALLGSYILRAATVTRRTASIGPMLPRKDPEVEPVDGGPDLDSVSD